MAILTVTHAATNVGAGLPVEGHEQPMHCHTAELTTSSGTGSAVVVHYGRNGYRGSWHAIATFTFTAAASGSVLSQTLEHVWDEYKSECTSISGTGASVFTTMTEGG
jgi:hypothetical protein